MATAGWAAGELSTEAKQGTRGPFLTMCYTHAQSACWFLYLTSHPASHPD